ncbi:MAG: SLBB domain-containing protein [Clostridiales bacterium]|jgi:NADH-quinone oxidoreductase subunit F|nr:SLBB domain-containing protein [Clostridiales bacterium]
MNETRIVLRNVGKINPRSIDDYVGFGGYSILKKAIEMGPDAIIDIIKRSGLRGRGGAGFPTGLKWEFTKNAASDVKYIVCNADEGEPGTNKDRIIVENDPNSVFEGMAIAGVAVGAEMGYIYLRVEYPGADLILRAALAEARAAGYLGQNIMNTGVNFDIEVVLGAGAYVCGEETALLNSMEGKRGEPRFKPPFPGVSGYHGKPTVINNGETFANITYIIDYGPEDFARIGTESSPGTKLFTLCGNVERRGVYEFPMGITLRELIYDVGGGIPRGRQLKAVQTGGSSGTFVTPDKLDMHMDMNLAAAHGATMGSGAVLVIDDRHSIPELALNITEFFVGESCGKCTPCREGAMRLYQLIQKFMSGEASLADIDTVKELSTTMGLASLCGLGQTVSTAILTTIDSFRDEYLAHTYSGSRDGRRTTTNA